ncbi:MAG: helix-turn-helix transcriptional regulator [Rhizomicrobium sp.]
MEHRLAEVRERRGMKQAELARRVGLSRGQVANLEAGNRTMDLPTLRRFARELDVPVTAILLPDDVPGLPDENEAQLLDELRSAPGYDARAIVVAVKAVIAAANSVREATAAPRELAGSAEVVRQMSEVWKSRRGRQRTPQGRRAAGDGAEIPALTA